MARKHGGPDGFAAGRLRRVGLQHLMGEAADNSNLCTPAINLYFAFGAFLEMMEKEGLEAISARHARHRRATSAAMQAIGLPLYATVGHDRLEIILVVPEGIDGEYLRKEVKNRFDILTAVAAIEATLQDLGLGTVATGAGVAAAAKELAAG